MDRPNLVLIVFDTARRDRFGCYGYHRGITPAVDDFAREAIVFDRMITPAPWTVPSHASLFTGLYPREHGADNPVPLLQSRVATLAAHLQAAGYATVCVTNNPLIHKETGLAGGFATILLRPGMTDGRGRFSRARGILGLRDAGASATNQVVAGLLGKLPKPFFLFINYLECHWHYTPPRAYERRFVRGYSWVRSVRQRLRQRNLVMWEAIAQADGEGLRLYNDLYDAELAYLDRRFAQLLSRFEQARLLDETVFLLTSDHGENIGEEGLASHQGSLRENLIHVPFLARVPGRRAARVEGLVQFTDVFGGLCRVLDLPLPEHLRHRPGSVDPFGLAPGEGGRAYAFAEWRHWGADKIARVQRRSPHFDFSRIPRGIEVARDATYKLLLDLGTGRRRLYDLARDPGERTDLVSERPHEADRLEAALGEWRAVHPEHNGSGYSAEEQHAVEARLRELGYL